LRDHGLLRIELLLVDGVGDGQPGIALEVEPGVGQLRLVLRLFCDRLIVRGLVGHRIDPGEDESLLDILPFNECNLDQLAVHLRTHGHGVERLRGADAVEIDRDIGGLRRRCKHRNRFARRAAAAASLESLRSPLCLPRLLCLRHIIDPDHARDDECADR
jgi:hypothetical protein